MDGGDPHVGAAYVGVTHEQPAEQVVASIGWLIGLICPIGPIVRVWGWEFMSMCDGDCVRGRDVSRPYNLLVVNGLRGAFFSGRWVDSGA